MMYTDRQVDKLDCLTLLYTCMHSVVNASPSLDSLCIHDDLSLESVSKYLVSSKISCSLFSWPNLGHSPVVIDKLGHLYTWLLGVRVYVRTSVAGSPEARHGVPVDIICHKERAHCGCAVNSQGQRRSNNYKATIARTAGSLYIWLMYYCIAATSLKFDLSLTKSQK